MQGYLMSVLSRFWLVGYGGASGVWAGRSIFYHVYEVLHNRAGAAKARANGRRRMYPTEQELHRTMKAPEVSAICLELHLYNQSTAL